MTKCASFLAVLYLMFTNDLVPMATSLNKWQNKLLFLHWHVKEALSYGEKIVKIGPVHPEIFDEIGQTT